MVGDGYLSDRWLVTKDFAAIGRKGLRYQGPRAKLVSGALGKNAQIRTRRIRRSCCLFEYELCPTGISTSSLKFGGQLQVVG